MIRLSVAALTNARRQNFSELIFFDVKAPTGNSADYKYAAAEEAMCLEWQLERSAAALNGSWKRR